MFVYKNVKRTYCIFCNITFQLFVTVYTVYYGDLIPSIGYLKIVSNAETDFLKTKTNYRLS